MTPKQKFLKRLTGFSLAISMTAVLVACGGGSADLAAGGQNMASYLNATLSNLSTWAGLSTPATLENFDVSYLDAGYTRAMLAMDLAANADALQTNPDLSLFPGGTLSNVVIAGCDLKDVCTMKATLTNSDADVTTVDFSTKVVLSKGAFRLLGDQAAS